MSNITASSRYSQLPDDSNIQINTVFKLQNYFRKSNTKLVRILASQETNAIVFAYLQVDKDKTKQT